MSIYQIKFTILSDIYNYFMSFFSWNKLTINPNDYFPPNLYSNKKFVYNHLLSDQKMTASMEFSKHSYQGMTKLENLSLFQKPKTSVTVRNGNFAYDQSTGKTMHWTANFADPHLFGYCQTPLFAQDEMQVAEHPGLAHLRTAIERAGQGTLKDGQVALITNVERFGAFDNALYGNKFAGASKESIKSHLKKFKQPQVSNIFAMAAPNIPGNLHKQPYQRDRLEKIFKCAYVAFQSIKETYGKNKEIVIHTGNFGCGAFGNDPKTVALLQIAAARLAGVKLQYYPIQSKGAFKDAQKLYEKIEKANGSFTAGQFLSHLADNAAAYNLRYGKGNGT